MTFEGKDPPPSLSKKVRYWYEIPPVPPYNARPLICINCHRIGHKADVCPHPQRCKGCGAEHEEMTDCVNSPECINCRGLNSALNPNCPNRAIQFKTGATRKPRRRQEAQRRQVEAITRQTRLLSAADPPRKCLEHAITKHLRHGLRLHELPHSGNLWSRKSPTSRGKSAF